MKQGSNIKIFIIAIIAIIILAGIAVICTIGFNKELRYENSQKIDVYIAQTIDLNKVKEITDGIKSTFGCTFPITFKNRCFAGSVIVNRIYACWMPNLTTNTWEAGNFRGYYQTKNTTADSFDIIYFVIGK